MVSTRTTCLKIKKMNFHTVRVYGFRVVFTDMYPCLASKKK